MERLYGLTDLAGILGIGAAALANRHKRTGTYGQDVPEPAYCYRSSAGFTSPLWTREQITEAEAARVARVAEALDRGAA